MKRIPRHLCCLLLFCMLIAQRAGAAPGDTTWVQAQNDVQLNNFNDFDVSVPFPNGSVTYRKIIMVFTLGKYQCPAGSQYCGDWDYTIQNFVMTPTDTFELARLITPYANATYPRTPWTWKQRYYFDVTDFAPVLRNNATIRLSYHNYSGGFTGNIRFAFIEGTPTRPVTGLAKLWNGSYDFGDPAAPIDNAVTARTLTAPAGTESAAMRFTVTGHGADNTGCAEFCSKWYQVKQNGTLLAQRDIWKADCGSNNLYPQSGTWVYDRANWCPGEGVPAAFYPLSNISAGSSYTADVDFQPYTRSGTGIPSYIVTGAVVHYGAFAHALDASIEEIIAPSDYEGNFRSNPTCGSTILRIRNNGGTTLTSVTFSYGVTGQTAQTHTVSGLSLAPARDTVLTLPELAELQTLPAGAYGFSASITQVNGAADGYVTDNTLRSAFVVAPDYPAQFRVILKNNNVANDTKWRIETLTGTVIAQRNTGAAQTSYTDNITLPANGCYRFVVTDNSCNGMYWWANSNTTGTGWVYLQRTDGTVLPLTNGLPNFPSGISQDFGCGFTQYFRVSGLTTATGTVTSPFEAADVFPSPFRSELHVQVTTARAAAGTLELLDLQGRVLYTRRIGLASGSNSFTVKELAPFAAGVYLVRISTGREQFLKKLVKQ